MRTGLLRAIWANGLHRQAALAQFLDKRVPGGLLLDQQAVGLVLSEAVLNNALERAKRHLATPSFQQDRMESLHLMALLVLHDRLAPWRYRRGRCRTRPRWCARCSRLLHPPQRRRQCSAR